MVLQLSPEKVTWLQEHGDAIEKHLAHGKNSCVWKVRGRLTTYALKTDHPQSDRWLPLSEEAAHLQDANRKGVGPRILEYNLVPELLFLEFIDGKPLNEWIEFEQDPLKIEGIIEKLFKQTRALDNLGLKHVTLTNELRNILVDRKNDPHILDFDKTKYVQNPQNTRELAEYLLNRKNKIAQKIQKVLGENKIKKWIEKLEK